MAKTSTSVSNYSLFYSLLLISSILFITSQANKVPIVKGLSFDFYSKTCPNLESIVREHLKTVFKQDNGQAPGLLRIFFHHCFVQTGGPDYAVPLGRRDGLSFSASGTNNLPSPFNTTGVTLNTFAPKNFDVTDVVALSGAHTFGRAHCGTFFNRLWPQDPNMDKTLAKKLQATCPSASSGNTTNLDLRTPNVFDNKYYLDLMNRQGVFTSDQDLPSDDRTKGLVNAFAVNQTLFFEKFVDAVIKLSQLDVLTGNQGEIRDQCNVINNKKSILTSVVEEGAQLIDLF